MNNHNLFYEIISSNFLISRDKALSQSFYVEIAPWGNNF